MSDSLDERKSSRMPVRRPLGEVQRFNWTALLSTLVTLLAVMLLRLMALKLSYSYGARSSSISPTPS